MASRQATPKATFHRGNASARPPWSRTLIVSAADSSPAGKQPALTVRSSKPSAQHCMGAAFLACSKSSRGVQPSPAVVAVCSAIRFLCPSDRQQPESQLVLQPIERVFKDKLRAAIPLNRFHLPCLVPRNVIEYIQDSGKDVKMNYRVPVIYEKGVLRLLEPLDVPEHTRLTVTVSVPKAGEHAASAQPRFRQPTRSRPLSQLEPLVGKMPAGGDALKDTEALYDADW